MKKLTELKIILNSESSILVDEVDGVEKFIEVGRGIIASFK